MADDKTIALLHEMATEMGCKGTEILDVYPDTWKDLKPDSPPSAFRAAVEQVKILSPNMFLEMDWRILADTDQARFKEREEKFRASIRTSHPVGVNPFKSLDAARLTLDEQQALTRHLQARGDSVDRSILSKAMSRQIQENGFLDPKGAA